METKQITINFGLVASPSFPAVARARVLAADTWAQLPLKVLIVHDVTASILCSLLDIGCVIENSVTTLSSTEPRLVIKCQYPWQAEIDDCAAPSVLKYEPYMRLYELAAYFAQDCVAVVPDGEQGLLVGAGAAKWGAFDSTKFITLD